MPATDARTFTGFTTSTIGLLRELPDFSRDDYADRKPEIVEHLLDPAKAFVGAALDELRDQVSPGLDGAAKVNGSISPLNNDLRFAPPGSPLYKDHLLLWFWEGPAKKGAPTIGVRIHPDGVGFAGGLAFDKAQLQRWRDLVVSDRSDEVAAAVAAPRRTRDAGMFGEPLKRVPRPYDADHPHAELLKHKVLQIHYQEPVPASITRKTFAGWCAARCAVFAPLHRLLVDEVA